MRISTWSGGVLLFLFGLYYRLVPAAGTCALAKCRAGSTSSGAILFPAGVALVMLKGDAFIAAPIVGSLIVIVAMALFAADRFPDLAGLRIATPKRRRLPLGRHFLSPSVA